MTNIIVARVAFRFSLISFELKVKLKLVLESSIFSPSDEIYYFDKEKQL